MGDYLVYINADSEGNITEGLIGQKVIPDKEYNHLFHLEKYVDLMDYKLNYDTGNPLLVKRSTE